jgi:hypothetical protein
MKSTNRERSREDKASNDRSTVPSPLNPAARAPLLWMQAAEALIDWYSAMFRLAFGVGRIDGLVTATEQSGSTTAAPPPAPVAALRSAAPVNLRAKRRKTRSKDAHRSRSSKDSRVTRRRAA